MVGAAFVIPCARLCVDSVRLVPGVKFTEETGMKLDQPVVWNSLCRLTTIARVDKFTAVVINWLEVFAITDHCALNINIITIILIIIIKIIIIIIIQY